MGVHLSERPLRLGKFVGYFCIQLLLLSCQSRPAKVDHSDVAIPSKSKTPTDSLAIARRKPTRLIKQNQKNTDSRRKSIYCEGDFLDYSKPQEAFLGLTVQFVYDQRNTIDMILLNDEEKSIQRLTYRVKQKESLKLAETHGNQTVLASHPEGLRLPGFPISRKIMALLPFRPFKIDSSETENQAELFGTLNFQNSKNEFVGGNQRLNCSFDP
jgi:hypothetical protein